MNNKLRDELAEAYATGNHRTSMPDTFDLKAFCAGWDARQPEIDKLIAALIKITEPGFWLDHGSDGVLKLAEDTLKELE